MSLNCRFCGSQFVRPSKLRLFDIPFRAFGRMPVRCRVCRRRFHVPQKQHDALRNVKSPAVPKSAA